MLNEPRLPNPATPTRQPDPPRLTTPNLVDELTEEIGRTRADAVVNGTATNPNER